MMQVGKIGVAKYAPRLLTTYSRRELDVDPRAYFTGVTTEQFVDHHVHLDGLKKLTTYELL